MSLHTYFLKLWLIPQRLDIFIQYICDIFMYTNCMLYVYPEAEKIEWLHNKFVYLEEMVCGYLLNKM